MIKQEKKVKNTKTQNPSECQSEPRLRGLGFLWIFERIEREQQAGSGTPWGAVGTVTNWAVHLRGCLLLRSTLLLPGKNVSPEWLTLLVF